MRCLWGRRIAAGMSLALASYGLAVAGPSSPFLAPAHAAENVSAAITDLGSPVLTLDADLGVHVRVDNPTDGAVNVNRIELRAQNNVTNSRQRVLNFLYGDRASVRRIAVLNEERKVAAHSSEEFIVNVPADEVSQLSSDWGPLGIEVNVDLTSGQDLTDRSMLVLPPRGEVKKAPTAFLLPLNFSGDEITSLANTDYFSFPEDSGDSDVSPEETSTTADATQATGEGTGKSEQPADASSSAGASRDAGSPESETSSEASTPADSAAPLGGAGAAVQAEGTAAAQASTLSPTQVCSSRLCTMLQALTLPGVTAYIQPNSNYSPVGITLEALKEFVAQTNTQLLMGPYADVDAHALSALGHEDVLKNAFSQASTSAALLGVPTQTNIALTAPGVDEKTAEDLASVGYGALIVADADAKPTREQRFTAGARIDLPVGNSRMAALRIDSDVSAALSGTLPLRANDQAQGGQTREKLSVLDSRQLALALSAATYRERPNVQRSMLIAVDRAGVPALGVEDIASVAGSSALASEHLRENVNALLSAPWVNGANVSQLLAGQVADVEYEALPSEDEASGALKAADYATARDARDSVNRLASLTSYSQQVGDRTEGSFERLLAYAWRGDAEGRRAQISAFSQAAAGAQGSLSIAPSSTINVISQTTDIPVHVRNDLPVDVGVVISMRSYDARLRSGNDVAVRIPANSSKSVTIPVRAVGSGDVTVVAELKTPDGTTLGSGRTIHVRVRADWENWGTGIVAVFFLGVLGFGVWRSLQRRKQGEKGRAA